MQIVLHIMARSSLRVSLRETIVTDLQKRDHELEVIYEKKVDRRGGWAKIHGKGLSGVINIFWHANSKTLIARAVGKQGNNPSELVGRFVAYLLQHRRKDISGLTMRTL